MGLLTIMYQDVIKVFRAQVGSWKPSQTRLSYPFPEFQLKRQLKIRENRFIQRGPHWAEEVNLGNLWYHLHGTGVRFRFKYIARAVDNEQSWTRCGPTCHWRIIVWALFLSCKVGWQIVRMVWNLFRRSRFLLWLASASGPLFPQHGIPGGNFNYLSSCVSGIDS